MVVPLKNIEFISKVFSYNKHGSKQKTTFTITQIISIKADNNEL